MNSEEKRLMTEALEIDLLLEGIWRQYGHDLRDYARAHMTRRLRQACQAEGFDHFGLYQHALLSEEETFRRLLDHLAIRVTEMFRDPPFFRALGEKIDLWKQVRRPLKVWVAGCASGEEAYSVAILFQERELLDQVMIYATDYNESLLHQARQGVYHLDRIRQYTMNYNRMGGAGSLSDHYSIHYGKALFHESLRQHIHFSSHNLVCDGSFGEMDMILCRNVMIYFNRTLQNRVLSLFDESLKQGGIFAMGLKESMTSLSASKKFEEDHLEVRIFRKKGESL